MSDFRVGRFGTSQPEYLTQVGGVASKVTHVAPAQLQLEGNALTRGNFAPRRRANAADLGYDGVSR